MFERENRGKRAAREAKAIKKKHDRQRTEISGRDAARLQRVEGRIVKYGFEQESDDDNQY